MGLCRSLAPGGDDDRGLFIVKAFLDTRFCVRSGTKQVQRKACLDEVAVADLVIVLLGGSCRRQTAMCPSAFRERGSHHVRHSVIHHSRKTQHGHHETQS